MDVKSTIPLLTQIIKAAPDAAIWNVVFALVAKQATTPSSSSRDAEPDTAFALVATQTTPPSSSFRNVKPDTPCKSTACSQQGSEQTHAETDERILQEIELCTYEKTIGFYEKYVENKSWSSIVARFAQEVNPQIVNGRWTDYPYPPTQTAFLEWVWRFQSRFPLKRRRMYYTPFNKSLDDSDCNRQPDLFLAPSGTIKSDGRYNWRDVRVIGELKESVSKKIHKRLLDSVETLVKFLQISPHVYSFTALSFMDLLWNSGYSIDLGHTTARDLMLMSTQIALSNS